MTELNAPLPWKTSTRPDLSIEIQDALSVPLAVMTWHPNAMHDRARLMAKSPEVLLAAGRAMDAAMMEIVGNGSLDLILHPELVDQMHKALNQVVAITGTPWREEK